MMCRPAGQPRDDTPGFVTVLGLGGVVHPVDRHVHREKEPETPWRNFDVNIVPRKETRLWKSNIRNVPKSPGRKTHRPTRINIQMFQNSLFNHTSFI